MRKIIILLLLVFLVIQVQAKQRSKNQQENKENSESQSQAEDPIPEEDEELSERTKTFIKQQELKHLKEMEEELKKNQKEKNQNNEQPKVETKQEVENEQKDETTAKNASKGQQKKKSRSKQQKQNQEGGGEEIIDADRKEIMEEWERLMDDFNPDDMLGFVVKKKETETFFEQIDQSTHIRGAYFVAYEQEHGIDFSIISPSKNLVFQRRNKREGIFSMELKEIGEYKIIFSNLRTKGGDKQVTFAIDVHNADGDHAKKNDINDLTSTMGTYKQQINDIFMETKFSSRRSSSHLHHLQQTHNKMLYLNLFEIVAIFIATVWQVYYIKKILDNKSIV